MKVGVSAIIFDNITPHSYKVILTLRGKGCRNHQGFWALPGGEVDEGEFLEQALRREIREEVALEIRDIQLYKIQEELIDNELWMNFVYVCRPYDKGVFPTNNEPHKFDKIEWLGFNMMDLENGHITEILTNVAHPISAISIPPLLEFKKLIITIQSILK